MAQTYVQQKKDEWSGGQADQRTKRRSNYPASPSAGRGILKRYEKFFAQAVAGREKFTACVLGATPELRDMVLARDGALTTIDISREMVEKCSRIMKHCNDSREHIVIGNWLDSGLPSRAFDVVLGDGVSNNVPFADQNGFFTAIHRILKQDGTLIMREATVNPRRPRRTVQEIDDDFTGGIIHWFDAFINLYLYSELTDKCRDDDTGKSEMIKFWSLVEEVYQRGDLSKKTFDSMWWFRGDLVHTFLNRPIFDRFIQKYFTLLPVKQATDFLFTQDTFLFFVGKPKVL